MIAYRHIYRAACIGLLVALALPAYSQQTLPRQPEVGASLDRARQSLAKQQPVFIENRGQWDRQVRFLLRTGGLDTWITDHGVVYDLYQLTQATNSEKQSRGILANRILGQRQEPEPMNRRGHVVAINFAGASFAPKAHGSQRQPGHYNYFIGSDSTRWATNVELYGGARVEGIYPGIDAVFYLDQGKPRYDLVVAPGGDPGQVRMSIEGAAAIAVTPEGALALATTMGTIEQRELYAYQQIGTARQQVACRFVVDGKGEVRFALGNYDRTRALVVDPLVYSTYLGGNGYDEAQGIAVDGSGNAYVTGHTISTDFPASGAYQSSFGGSEDAFMTKLNSDGSSLVYSTYLGGSSFDHGYGIAVDGNGNAYVTGSTQSTDFPTSGGYQSSLAGASDVISGDAFVTKLNSDGSSLAYSTYLGGSYDDVGYGIKVDGSSNAYITGYTYSTDFPTYSAYQSSNAGGIDAFLTKLSSDGSTLAYSTYLGGYDTDLGYGIAVDGNGNAYITGITGSTDFPTSGAYQSSLASSIDAFVAKLSGNGSSLVYSTYLGGSIDDYGYGIAVDGSGNAYIAGITGSTDFPTSGAYQSSSGGTYDAYVTKLNSDGSSLVYSTYLGGSSDDYGAGIAVDGSGNVYVTGSTQSTDFPTSDAYQSSNAGNYDAFVTKLNSDGSSLAYSTYYGGSSFDPGYGIAVDGSGNAYITGITSSMDFPTLGAYQSSYAYNYDAFVTKFGSDASIALTSPNDGESWCAGSTQAITWTSTGITNVRIELSSNGGSTFPTTIIASTSAATGSYSWSIPASQAGGTGYRVRVSDAGNSSINDASDASFTIVNDPPTLNVSLSPTTLWPPNNQMRTITISASASDNCGSASWVLTSVTGNDGTAAADINAATGTAPASISLRARRSGSGNGRTYSLVFTASDDNGNTTVVTCTVLVPVNQSDKIIIGTGSESSEHGFASSASPNPFGSSTTIGFRLAAAAAVRIGIYDGLGNAVAVVLDAEMGSGVHESIWNGQRSDGTAATSGQYYYRIESGGLTETGMVTLVR